MPENEFVKETFNRLASSGFLGDPRGELAYCYVRVSTVQQAEEGRSGLPRQINHCHEAALLHHLKIPWAMVFADDGFSGFEFENRPALSRLREEIKTKPISHYVVIEHLDRLSRNARWHQGFLLEEFATYDTTPVFWKAFSSEIERAVMGTIAEEGMRSEISRMADGTRLKAQSGRVTAKRPRFGFMFVDSEGKVSEKVKKDTHYALHPEKSRIVRWIYNSIIRDHKSLGQVASEMNENKIPPIFTSSIWCAATIHHMVCDPIYKGEFFAHRWYREETGELNAQGRPKGIARERPREEWIKIDVPPIVTPQEWQLAQEILSANQKRSLRNMKRRQWLLSSFIKCAVCEYAYVTSAWASKKSGLIFGHYRCSGRTSERARLNGTCCQSPCVRADEFETFVWAKIEAIITNPELVLQLIDEANKDEEVIAEDQHLKYIGDQLTDVTARYERWKEAYESKAITLDEYKEFRAQYNKQQKELQDAREEIARKQASRMSVAAQKEIVLEGLTELRQQLPNGEPLTEIPFELKRRILRCLVDWIWIDSITGTIRLEGVLKATYEMPDTLFVFSSARRWR